MGLYVHTSHCNRHKIDENTDFCINLTVMACKMIKNMKCACDTVDTSLQYSRVVPAPFAIEY